MRKWISYFTGVILIFTAVYFYSLGTENVTVFFATISLIMAIALFIMADAKNYNKAIDTIKRVDGAEGVTIEEVFQALSNLDTPLGKPWMGGIVTIPQQCIIWGPSPTGEMIYAYKTKLTKSIYLSIMDGMVDDRDESEKIPGTAPQINVEELDYQEIVCYQFQNASLLEDLCHEVELYVKERRIEPLPGHGPVGGKLYRFNEDFKLTGQKFYVCNMEKEPLYEVNGTFPLKTFRITEVGTGREIFSMKKRLLHIFPHYDFYMDGQKYASFRKKLNLLHTTFTMQTKDGLLEMRSVNTTIGDNYQVKMNGEVIGNICEKLNLSLYDIVFDNFVLYVREEKYTVLLAALATMAAREMARDRAADESDD